MRCRIAVRRRDHRHIFVVNFDRQVVHSDSLDARMRNENRNLLGTTREKKNVFGLFVSTELVFGYTVAKGKVKKKI